MLKKKSETEVNFLLKIIVCFKNDFLLFWTQLYSNLLMTLEVIFQLYEWEGGDFVDFDFALGI